MQDTQVPFVTCLFGEDLILSLLPSLRISMSVSLSLKFIDPCVNFSVPLSVPSLYNPTTNILYAFFRAQVYFQYYRRINLKICETNDIFADISSVNCSRASEFRRAFTSLFKQKRMCDHTIFGPTQHNPTTLKQCLMLCIKQHKISLFL